jgi:hypothetical protein
LATRRCVIGRSEARSAYSQHDRMRENSHCIMNVSPPHHTDLVEVWNKKLVNRVGLWKRAVSRKNEDLRNKMGQRDVGAYIVDAPVSRSYTHLCEPPLRRVTQGDRGGCAGLSAIADNGDWTQLPALPKHKSADRSGNVVLGPIKCTRRQSQNLQTQNGVHNDNVI